MRLLGGRLCLSPAPGTARMKGMTWLNIVVQTFIGWLLEIPPDLLGRRIESMLDRAADRTSLRKKRTHRHKRGARKRKSRGRVWRS